MRKKLLVVTAIVLATSMMSMGCSKEADKDNKVSNEQTEASDVDKEDETDAEDETEEATEASSVSSVEEFTYYDVDEGVVIDGYTGSASVIEIPETIDGKSVVHIADNAFKGCEMTSVKIPNTVKTIGETAFSKCENLESVELGTSVETIYRWAFSECDKLSSAQLPASTVSSLAPFFGCDSLTTVVDNSSCTEIVEAAYYKSGLKEYTVPGTVTKIGSDAFGKTTDLVITIPATVTEISDSAFDDATNVTIKGAVGSYAETYAKDNGITFEAQ